MNIQTTTLVLITLILVATFVLFFREKRKVRRLRLIAKNNLGSVADDLGHVMWHKIVSPTVTLIAFYPISEHVNPKVAPEMLIGYGLLANPDYRGKPTTFVWAKICFKWG